MGSHKQSMYLTKVFSKTKKEKRETMNTNPENKSIDSRQVAELKILEQRRIATVDELYSLTSKIEEIRRSSHLGDTSNQKGDMLTLLELREDSNPLPEITMQLPYNSSDFEEEEEEEYFPISTISIQSKTSTGRFSKYQGENICFICKVRETCQWRTAKGKR